MKRYRQVDITIKEDDTVERSVSSVVVNQEEAAEMFINEQDLHIAALWTVYPALFCRRDFGRTRIIYFEEFIPHLDVINGSPND